MKDINGKDIPMPRPKHGILARIGRLSLRRKALIIIYAYVFGCVLGSIWGYLIG